MGKQSFLFTGCRKITCRNLTDHQFNTILRLVDSDSFNALTQGNQFFLCQPLTQSKFQTGNELHDFIDYLSDLAARFNVPLFLVHAVSELKNRDKNLPRYWQQRAALQKKLREQFHPIETAVGEVIAETPRARSLIENLNSRLRNYFFLRRHIGNDYLDLLRFFLNHRRFQRSDRPERVGKSPAELLNGQPHPHWLELLGFKRFQRN